MGTPKPETCCGHPMAVALLISEHVTEYACPICGAHRIVGSAPQPVAPVTPPVFPSTPPDGWSTEWPTKPGTYWFHGYLGRSGVFTQPKTRLVTAVAVPSGALVFSTANGFLSRDEGMIGWWRPMEVPVPAVVEGVCVALRSTPTTVWVSRRNDGVAWRPGLWQLPGGKVDPGESPVAAAVRELREETGIARGRLDLSLLGSWHMPEGGSTGAPFLLHAFEAPVGADFPLQTEPDKAGPWEQHHVGRVWDEPHYIQSAKLAARVLLHTQAR